MNAVPVAELLASGGELASLKLVVDDADLDRVIAKPRIQKSGLALVGHVFGIDPRRIQVLGETELSYLDRLAPVARSEASAAFFSLGLSCAVVTRGASPPPELLAAAAATRTALVVSPSRSSATITALHDYLDDRLAETTTVHGVLLDVFGLGVLVLGKSGIGKSEAALDLVARGHRLVADDVVRLSLRPRREILGSPVGMLRHHLEVRGLGILDVRELFGIVAVAESKRVNLVVELVEWRDDEPYDRLGLDAKQHVLLGVARPLVTVPVKPGRDMAVIIEIAARNELLKQTGHKSAERFAAELDRQLAKGKR